jgi:hypothetical protein
MRLRCKKCSKPREHRAKNLATKRKGWRVMSPVQPEYCEASYCEPQGFGPKLRHVTLVTLRSVAASVLLRRQRNTRTYFCWRWARGNRIAVQGGNLLDGGRNKRAHESYHQDRNPDRFFHGFVSYPHSDFTYRNSCNGKLARSRIIRDVSSYVCNIFHRENPDSYIYLPNKLPLLDVSCCN